MNQKEVCLVNKKMSENINTINCSHKYRKTNIRTSSYQPPIKKTTNPNTVSPKSYAVYKQKPKDASVTLLKKITRLLP